jgi:hypothetical protein
LGVCRLGHVLLERVAKAEFLTVNEKRQAVGYSPVDGGDRR